MIREERITRVVPSRRVVEHVRKATKGFIELMPWNTSAGISLSQNIFIAGLPPTHHQCELRAGIIPDFRWRPAAGREVGIEVGIWKCATPSCEVIHSSRKIALAVTA